MIALPTTWMIIGLLLNSTITSQHQNREECEGRAAMLREKGAYVRCIEATPMNTYTPGNTFILR